jgi:signal transduction histidine kinase
VMGLEGGIFVVNTGMEEDDKGQISEGWEMVQRNVGKISRLVKDLLYCSREREPCYRDGVAPDSVLREVHELYRSRTERDGIALRLELEGPIEPGRYDPEGIHNLVANLVANAIDACRFDPDDGKEHVITIRGFASGGGITIQVRDNGPGIPEEQAERVFKGFFSTKGTEGTGLGLLVVRKVATEHGGTVTLDTAVGEGTTFTVTLLPCAGGGTAVAAGREPPAKGDP